MTAPFNVFNFHTAHSSVTMFAWGNLKLNKNNLRDIIEQYMLENVYMCGVI